MLTEYYETLKLSTSENYNLYLDTIIAPTGGLGEQFPIANKASFAASCIKSIVIF